MSAKRRGGWPRAGLVAILAAASLSHCVSSEPAASTKPLQLLVVLDGLRPDYVTAELMPRLDRLARQGVRFTDHHSVFPTVTRVNAASIVTGAYPERHGLLGNTVFFPAVDPAAGLSTSSRQSLLDIRRTEGSLLQAADLGEVFAAAGRRVLAVSSGSQGSAYLLDRGAGGGAILHPDYTLPAEVHGELLERLGPAPEESSPNDDRNRWVVDALLEIGLQRFTPDLVVLWLADPDHTAHEHGIGDPTTEDALQRVDAELGRLLDELGRRDYETNVLVTSDHGFSTHRGGIAAREVVQRFAGRTADGHPDLVLAGHAIYDRTGNPERLRRIVEALQVAPGVGALFTAPASPDDLRGSVPGTLSFAVAGWGHERAGDILLSPDWSDEANEHGWAGSSTAPGVAGHGTSGRWDIHNTLVAAGPGFSNGLLSRWPSGNVDLAPTLVHMAGLEVPGSMQGRVLREALAGGSQGGETPRTETVTVANQVGDVTYTLRAVLSDVVGSRYLDYTVVERRQAATAE